MLARGRAGSLNESMAGEKMTSLQLRVLLIAILASFVAFLDGAVINVALPAIDKELGGGLPLQQWVVDAYLVTLTAFLLLGGALVTAGNPLYREELASATKVELPHAAIRVVSDAPVIGAVLDAIAEDGGVAAPLVRDRLTSEEHPSDFLVT